MYIVRNEDMEMRWYFMYMYLCISNYKLKERINNKKKKYRQMLIHQCNLCFRIFFAQNIFVVRNDYNNCVYKMQ